MKRALIVASVGVLASTAWVVLANAQANINPNQYPGNRGERYGAQPYEWYGAPGPNKRGGMCVTHVDPLRGYGYQAPCPAPQAAAPRRAARRSARNSGAPPAVYAGGTAFTPGSGGPPYNVTTGSYAANSAQPNEWYAAPGPNRRGNMCITHVDSLRGYGYQSPCPKK
jgi:hypothetical protein